MNKSILFLTALLLSGCVIHQDVLKNTNISNTSQDVLSFPKPSESLAENISIYQENSVRNTEEYSSFNRCIGKKVDIYQIDDIVETCREKYQIHPHISLLKYEEMRIEFLEELAVKYFTEQTIHQKNMSEEFQTLNLIYQRIIENLDFLKKQNIYDAEFLHGYLLLGTGLLLKDVPPQKITAEAISHFQAAFKQGHEEASSVLISLYLNPEFGTDYNYEQALSVAEEAIDLGMLSTALKMFFILHDEKHQLQITTEDSARLLSKIDQLFYQASLSPKTEVAAYLYLAEKYWHGWGVKKNQAKAIAIYKKFNVKRNRFLTRIERFEKTPS